jgi:hypothetical protein
MEAPPVIHAERQRFRWLLAGLVVAVLAAAGTVLFLFNPSLHSFYPRCMLYTMTGIYCPGCGSQRALHQLFHGHLETALRCNALLVLGLPVLAVYFGRRFGQWLTGGMMAPFTISSLWLKVVVGGIVLFTILRNIPCAPFNWLAPLE